MSQGAIIRRLRLSFQTGRSIGSLLMKARGMKAAWHLAASDGALSAAEIVALYGKRWIIEPSFRDTKDLRFGMGMSELRIDDPQRISGSRLPSWIELGFVLNNFIGNAGFLLSPTKASSRVTAGEEMSLGFQHVLWPSVEIPREPAGFSLEINSYKNSLV